MRSPCLTNATIQTVKVCPHSSLDFAPVTSTHKTRLSNFNSSLQFKTHYGTISALINMSDDSKNPFHNDHHAHSEKQPFYPTNNKNLYLNIELGMYNKELMAVNRAPSLERSCHSGP